MFHFSLVGVWTIPGKKLEVTLGTHHTPSSVCEMQTDICDCVRQDGCKQSFIPSLQFAQSAFEAIQNISQYFCIYSQVHILLNTNLPTSKVEYCLFLESLVLDLGVRSHLCYLLQVQFLLLKIIVSSVTSKKSPNVYKKWPKTNFTRK